MDKILAFLNSYKIHFIAWGVFVFCESIAASLVSGSFGTLANYLGYYSINIVLFYVHAKFVLPLVLKDKEKIYWSLPLGLLIELIAYSFIIYCAGIIRNEEVMYNLKRFLLITWRWLYFAFFSTAYYALLTYLDSRKIQEEIERELLIKAVKQEKIEKDLEIAKNAYLKAQINPHFLFNTLDFIYHDVVQHSSKSADAVLGLVEIMRYGLDVDCFGEYVEMGMEIEQAKTLASLHRLRSDGKESLTIQYDDDLKSLKIIPLAILTLVENMFKHGNLKDEEGQINMYVKDQRIYVHTVNMMYEGRKAIGFGSGLNNIEQRLLDKYKGEAEFSYAGEANVFKVELSVPII